MMAFIGAGLFNVEKFAKFKNYGFTLVIGAFISGLLFVLLDVLLEGQDNQLALVLCFTLLSIGLSIVTVVIQYSLFKNK